VNYQIIYQNDPDGAAVCMEIIEAGNIGAAVEAIKIKLGVTEAQILAVILVNE